MLVVWTPSAANLNTTRVLYILKHKSLINEEMSQRQHILKSFLLSQRLRILLEHSWKLLLLGHIHKTLQLIKHRSYFPEISWPPAIYDLKGKEIFRLSHNIFWWKAFYIHSWLLILQKKGYKSIVHYKTNPPVFWNGKHYNRGKKTKTIAQKQKQSQKKKKYIFMIHMEIIYIKIL